MFIKYSVVELGVEEDVPGWVKQAQTAKEEQERLIAEANEELTKSVEDTETTETEVE